MWLLIPSRHHLVTKNQIEQIKQLVNKYQITGIIWAITSANQSGTRKSPLPANRREVMINLVAGKELPELEHLVFHIDFQSYHRNYVQYIIEKIRVEHPANLTITPENALVLATHDFVIAEFQRLGFSVEITNTSANLPWQVIEQIAQTSLSNVQTQLPKSVVNYYRIYNFEDLIKTIFADPLLGDEGELTATRDMQRYVQAFDDGAARKYAVIQQHIKHGKIVDIGCCAGSLIKQMSDDVRLDDSDFYGIEISSKLIQICHQRKDSGYFGTDNVFFYQRNILNQPLFAENSIDTFITISLLHEIFSYGSEQQLKELLAELYRQLKPGGRLIILDVIGPESKSSVVKLKLNDQDGSNPQDLMAANPAELSTKSKFIKFCQDFRQGYQEEWNYQVVNQNGQELYQTTLETAAEFLSKKDYVQNWKSEMHERFCFWSESDWRNQLSKIGFKLASASGSFTNDWIVQNRYQGKVEIIGQEYPPTNILLIAKK